MLLSFSGSIVTISFLLSSCVTDHSVLIHWCVYNEWNEPRNTNDTSVSTNNSTLQPSCVFSMPNIVNDLWLPLDWLHQTDSDASTIESIESLNSVVPQHMMPEVSVLTLHVLPTLRHVNISANSGTHAQKRYEIILVLDLCAFKILFSIF